LLFDVIEILIVIFEFSRDPYPRMYHFQKSFN
jgi:hypothetical protein